MPTTIRQLRLAARRLTATHVGHWARRRPAAAVVTVAFALRIAVIPLTVFRINPYSTHDALKFGAIGARIGTGLFAGPLVSSLTDGDIFHFWGLMLAPFWALPGPSWVYAHVWMAALGALAVWNVATIGREWHSPVVGVLAAAPVAVYPSFVLVHATLLPEAAVLAGITTVVRLAIAPPARLGRSGQVALVSVVLALTVLLRPENAPLYAMAIAVGVAVQYHHHWRAIRREHLATVGTTAFVGGLMAVLALAPRIVGYFAHLPMYRPRGQSGYLTEIVPRTIPAAVAFVPIGALYFLFAPFPWMIERVPEIVVYVEAVGNVVFAIAAIIGVVHVLHRRLAGVVALTVGFVLASLLYGFVEGTVKTAVRHRQMFVWVLYLFGAVGVIEWLKSHGAWRSRRRLRP